jgi:hypothetical protein
MTNAHGAQRRQNCRHQADGPCGRRALEPACPHATFVQVHAVEEAA